MKEKTKEGISQIKFSFRILVILVTILFFCFFSLIPEAGTGQVVNVEESKHALKSVLTISLAQTFENSVKLSQRKELFKNIIITKPILIHDQILDLLNEASQKDGMPEDGVSILNVDAHMDFGSSRYTELFCEGSWDREAFKKKFASNLMSSEFNEKLDKNNLEEKEKAINAQWDIALQRLGGTWCNVAISRRWAKCITVIRPGTFDKFKRMPEIARAEIERLKSAKEPIWVTIDYDYFSREEHYPERNIYIEYHCKAREVEEKVYAIINFLLENKVKVQRLVPVVSPGYISQKADDTYIDYLTITLKQAFKNDGSFTLRELAAMDKEDSEIINYYLTTLVDLEVFARVDEGDKKLGLNYMLDYKIYPALKYRDFIKYVKSFLEGNNFPIPEHRTASLKQEIKHMSDEFNLKAYVNNERGL